MTRRTNLYAEMTKPPGRAPEQRDTGGLRLAPFLD